MVRKLAISIIVTAVVLAAGPAAPQSNSGGGTRAWGEAIPSPAPTAPPPAAMFPPDAAPAAAAPPPSAHDPAASHERGDAVVHADAGPGTLAAPPTVTVGGAPPGAPPRPADPCPPGRDWVYSDLGRWYCQ